MIRALRSWVGLFLVLSIPWIATDASAAPKRSRDRVTGTATYRERIALPPNAEFEASLVEESRVDRSALVIGHVRKNRLAPAPIAFSISYDPRDIHGRGRYVVRATVTERGRVRFTGSEPVLTHGHGNNVAILMRNLR